MWTGAKSRLLRTSVALSASLAAGCSAPELDIHAVGQLDYGGRVERIETLGRYSSLEATLLFQLSGNHSKVASENDYFLYRVTYPTTGLHGGTTSVSALIGIPAIRDIKGIVSWQHGTNTYRPNSISKPSLPEGLGVAALFAGDGYIVVAADYIGLGVSTEVHPYYHWPSTTSTVVDLLAIAEVMLDGLATTPDKDLYLAGFSQGGGATAAVQKFLQESNPTALSLRGAATISAAFNPRDHGLPNAIESDNPFYLAMILAAFSYVYDQPLDGIVRARYADQLPVWFDGSHDQKFLDEHLPDHVDQFVTDAFLQDYEAGRENPQWFYDALELAGTYDYAPEAPLRILFGNKDTIVTPADAQTAFAHMQSLGGNVELVDMGAYDHDEIVLPSLPRIQQWFDDLDRSAR